MVRKRNLANNREIETIDVMTNTNIRIYGYNNNMCQRIFVKNIENWEIHFKNQKGSFISHTL